MVSLRQIVHTGTLAVCTVSAWEFTSPDRFDSIAAANDHTLVAFVRPEIQSCKSLEAEWAAAKKSCENMIAIDCVAEAQFCEEHDVGSHPAIRAYFPDNTIERYRGRRKATSISSFYRRVSNPVVADVTPANVSSFLASDDVVIIAQASLDDTSLVDNFESVASKYHDRYSFGLMVGESNSPPAVRCQNNLDRREFSMPTDQASSSNMAALDNFVVSRCAAPLVGEMTRRNELAYMKPGKSVVMYFGDSDDDRDAYVAQVRDLAGKFAEFLVFVTVDTNEYPDMVPASGHAAGANGVLALRNPHNGQVFPLAAEVTAANVEALIMDISKGKVKPWDGQSAPVQAKGTSKVDGGKTATQPKAGKPKDKTLPVEREHNEL